MSEAGIQFKKMSDYGSYCKSFEHMHGEVNFLLVNIVVAPSDSNTFWIKVKNF